MACLNPVILKSGIVVPCGKCDVCRSDQRTQWSIRLAIHASYCDRMPLFITLTYDDEHLPFHENGHPTVCRPDLSKFLKAYKRKFGLNNDKFQYFGCCEYGDAFGRPHAHLLFFGDDDLYNIFFQDSELAQARLKSVWDKGNVFIGVAQWSGIHYVTKYILKEDIHEIENLGIIKPFLIASKGLGTAFFDSQLAIEWRKRLQWLAYNKEDVINHCPEFSLDSTVSIDCALDYLRRYLPSWLVPVDDGRFVYLPRPLRMRLIGSFEHFKDSPIWLYSHLLQVRKSLEYYRHCGDNVEAWKDNVRLRLEKIQKRLLNRKYNNIYKHSKV